MWQNILNMLWNLWDISDKALSFFSSSDLHELCGGWIPFTLIYMILERNESRLKVQAQASGVRAHKYWPGPGNLCGWMSLATGRGTAGWMLQDLIMTEVGFQSIRLLGYDGRFCHVSPFTSHAPYAVCLFLMFDHAVFFLQVLLCPRLLLQLLSMT